MFSNQSNGPKKLLFKTREVMVGSIGVGGDNPIRIQSMTTSNTRDVDATVDQIMKLSDYGCEIARVTVQGIKEADSCELIKNKLLQKGYTIPVVADIHFYPPAAMRVIDFVDKVRVNPGNFLDKRASFKIIEYDDNSYQEELRRIEEGLSPLIEKCKKLKKALRIGTNHGSLSDRIMSRYGDTPRGMVESALEFARVCRSLDYHDFIFSMKASHPLVMIEAYRKLVSSMLELGWNYPLHLGVTEAGEGEDGRIKSAVGMGSLLIDGIGDTIRVSLTEDPWHEIDPCKKIRNYIETYQKRIQDPSLILPKKLDLPIALTTQVLKDTLHQDGSLFVSVSEEEILEESFFKSLGFKDTLGSLKPSIEAVQGIILKGSILDSTALKKLNQLKQVGTFVISELDLIKETGNAALSLSYIKGSNEAFKLSQDSDMIFFKPNQDAAHDTRKLITAMSKELLQKPLILSLTSDDTYDDLVINMSVQLGSILADGIGQGIHLDAPRTTLAQRCQFGLNLLQACRRRSTKTDYIACPGCGRTLFDLQEVTKQIKAKTAHLPGVKIAVMGCIVNGPGEMADADFGYVGTRPGMIDLYIGKTCVEKNIPSPIACNKLIELIKQQGRWVDLVC